MKKFNAVEGNNEESLEREKGICTVAPAKLHVGEIVGNGTFYFTRAITTDRIFIFIQMMVASLQ